MTSSPARDALCDNYRDDPGPLEASESQPVRCSSEPPRVLVVGAAPFLDGFEALWRLSGFGWVLRVTKEVTTARRIAFERGADVLLVGSEAGNAALGFELCRELRGSGCELPIVALVASDTLADRVAAVEAGVDDVVVLGVTTAEELHGRLTVAVRYRTRRAVSESPSRIVHAGPIQVNLSDEAVLVQGKVMHLPVHQRALLIHLASVVERVVSRAELCEAVGMTPGLAFKNLHNEVFRLRTRLGPEAARHLRAVRGSGYVLTAIADPAAAPDAGAR